MTKVNPEGHATTVTDTEVAAPETVAETTTEATPVVAATENNSAAPVADESSFLKGIAGGKFQKLEELNKHLAELETKASEDPFVNPYVKGLNDAVKNGIDPDVYAQVASVDPAKLSDKEALILGYQWRDNLTEEEATLLVESKFRFAEEDDPADQDVKLARIEAKTLANQARENLSSHKEDALTPPHEKQVAKQKEAWAPQLQKAIDANRTITLEGKTGKLEFPVPDSVLASAKEALEDVINNGKVMVLPDESGMNLAKSVAYNHILAKSMGAIVDHIYDHFNTQAAMDNHNPSGHQQPVTSPTKSDDMKRAEFLAKHLNVRLN